MGEEELKVLYAKRRNLKATVTRFSKFLDQVNDQSVNQLQIRLEKLDNILEEFDEVQLNIELQKPTELELTVREEFETHLFESISRAKQKLSIFNAEQAQVNQLNNSNISGGANALSTGIQIQGSDLELRKFCLPTFNGNYDQWFKFKNTFVSLVDRNPKFDKVQKFYRLLECLKGDAEKVLSELEVSEDNYDVAWNILVDRFEDKPGIIQKHLKAIVDLEAVQRDSVYDIRKFIDEFNGHWRALKSLGEPIEKWDRMLILLLSRKLPGQTKMSWEETRVGKFKGEPSIDDFKAYLVEKCKSLEAHADKEKHLKTNHQAYSKRDLKLGTYISTNYEGKCKFCKAQHQIYFCEKLKELPVEKRWEEIKKLKLCTNCLRANHYVRECRSDGCRKCGIKHNTILHYETAKNINTNKNIVSTVASGQGQSTSAEVVNHQSGIDSQEVLSTHCNSLNKSQILLSTTTVFIRDIDGNYVKARCLLDTGSQSCFITTKMVKLLRLPISNISVPVVGVNKCRTFIKMKTQTRIKSMHDNYVTEESFFILDQITSIIPNVSFDKPKLNIPNNLKLADEMFNVASEIDILLNARIFFETLCDGQIRLGNDLPILQQTLFGWIVAGPLTIKPICTDNESVCNLSIFNELCDIEKFWNIEEVESNQNVVKFSREEIECEQHFSATVARNDGGKFIVTLPTRTNLKDLGASLNIAEKRLFAIEKKFVRNPEFKDSYVNFMREYLKMGHMSPISNETIKSEKSSGFNGKVFYLPHHGVINSHSETTKLRVVFDGSCKTDTNLSLNDVLKVGPSIQDDLFAILCRFRRHNVVITADIEKMYRMIMVDKNQRDLQRIVWRESEAEEIKHYRLNTVTYGTGPASFLAMRCLKQISLNIVESLPEVAQIIEKDFYMDDLITGGDTVDQAINLAMEISKILMEYGLNLRKWNSNETGVKNELLSSENGNVEGHFLKDSDISKTLGIFWNARSDNLEYVINNPNRNCSQITKRRILSSIARIFDPLGLLGPVITRAKIMMQQLWQLKIGWDDLVPAHLLASWRAFEDEFDQVHEIRIPRHISVKNGNTSELHGFCDASERAYGACIFARSVGQGNDISIRLLCAKSRVAPLKTISLPKLELCGAVLLTRLMKRVRETFIGNFEVRYWCDSKIVLAWLAEEPHVWKSFVANRVSEIQGSSKIQTWGHVESHQNPADLISRGCNPSKLVNNQLWWNGPQFLNQYGDVNKSNLDNAVINDIPERKRIKLVTLSVNDDKLVLIVRKIWVAIDLLTRALLPSVTTVCYTLIKNPQTVVYSVRNQLIPALVAFLANSISRSLASVQRISLPLTLRIIREDQRQAALTNGEEVDTVPEKSVECLVLAEPDDIHADVIFIHGLHGGIDKTWKQGTWRQDWHKLKHQTPIRRQSTEDMYVPPRQQSLKRTISGIYSKIPNKIARRDREIYFMQNELEWDSDDTTYEDGRGYSECWPKDWIPKDCPNARVIALNYSTDVLWSPVWSKKRHRTNMVTRSQEMIEELVKLGVGKRPIVWVGHSKGGLFIKQILVNAWEKNQHRREILDLFRQSKSIMWYSVPHKGSSLADCTFPLLRRSVELLEIQRNCDFMLDLHKKFLCIIKESKLSPEVFSFIETSFTLMTFIYLKIVAYDSADPNIGIKCDVPLDHREICKPAGRDCFLYLELVKLINKCIKSDGRIRILEDENHEEVYKHER